MSHTDCTSTWITVLVYRVENCCAHTHNHRRHMDRLLYNVLVCMFVICMHTVGYPFLACLCGAVLFCVHRTHSSIHANNNSMQTPHVCVVCVCVCVCVSLYMSLYVCLWYHCSINWPWTMTWSVTKKLTVHLPIMAGSQFHILRFACIARISFEQEIRNASTCIFNEYYNSLSHLQCSVLDYWMKLRLNYTLRHTWICIVSQPFTRRRVAIATQSCDTHSHTHTHTHIHHTCILHPKLMLYTKMYCVHTITTAAHTSPPNVPCNSTHRAKCVYRKRKKNSHQTLRAVQQHKSRHILLLLYCVCTFIYLINSLVSC